MKTIILAGGFGTRIAEETALKPKPMVEVGGHPLLWHLMQIYAAHGFNDFVVACGYRGEVIKDYFASFDIRNSDVRVDLTDGSLDIERRHSANWRVACIDTGVGTMTGGRVKALKDELGSSTFMVTYGDGLANVDIAALVDFHRSHGKSATVTAVHPPARFGAMDLGADDSVVAFQEKVQSREGWINGGFFVFEPEVLDFIADPATRLEAEPLSDLADAGELMAYRHGGFWQPMDTLREKAVLERLWEAGDAPWMVW
ncbi:MAG: glucose-1-phosphate cytidylyltransferase [Acidimicrobiia bacterium]|nr:glucose-1-phosphate cytidylyltransferase [Acidimicrobiia bacterium]